MDKAGIDSIRVGDSLGMVVLGYENTLPVTMEEMLHHCRAVARGLAQVELYLANNDVQEAVADLFELARRFPNDARVQARLARLLHQRALLLYGQGSVSGAIADWEHLLEIYPSHPLAADLLRAARSEASPAPNHRPGRSRVRNGSPR